jgi:DNA-binding response OmpR family regulator
MPRLPASFDSHSPRIRFLRCNQVVISGPRNHGGAAALGNVRLDMTTVSSDAPVGQDRRAGAGGQTGIRLAVIDSDTGFLQVLGKRLEGAGWPYRVLASPVPLDAMVAMRLNAVVLDLAVLGPQGWSYLDKLCTRLPHLGVVVCTGQSSVAQRVRGLRLGADDWVTKPCHPEELIARVEAVVRRRKRADVRVERGPTVVGEVEIRADQFQAFVGGASVELTRREFELIQLLAEAEGQVLQREEIYQRVWGYAMVHGDRSVDVFVRKLRSKLERVSPGWRYIHTHFGIGYRFAAEPVDPSSPPVDEMVEAPDAAVVLDEPTAELLQAG